MQKSMTRCSVTSLTASLPILLLVGCASAPVDHMLLTHDCQGRELTVRFKEYLSVAPAIDCVRLTAACGASDGDLILLAAQFPIACAYRGPLCSVVVLPVVGADLARDHEYEHLAGKVHPAFSFAEPQCPIAYSKGP